MELGWKEKFMRYARQIFVIEFFFLSYFMPGRETFFSFYTCMHTLMLVLFLLCVPDR